MCFSLYSLDVYSLLLCFCRREIISELIFESLGLYLCLVRGRVSEFDLLSDMFRQQLVSCILPFGMWCLSAYRISSVNVVFAVCMYLRIFKSNFSFFCESYLVCFLIVFLLVSFKVVFE